MSKRFVTIVSDGKGKFSYHTSWKSVCEAYGWEYETSVPSVKGDYTIKKAPLDVIIPCLDLVEFVGRKNVVQSSSKNAEGYYEFEISGYDIGYSIITNFRTEHEEADYHNGDRGQEEISAAFDYHVPEEVQSVHIHDEDGTEIKIDPWTAEQLLDYLTIEM